MIQNTIKKITKIKPKLSTSGGTSDARFIRKISPCVEFGLVGKTMHKVNESVSIADLKKLTNIDEFEYTYHKGQNPTTVSDSTLAEMVPTTPEAYEIKVNEIKVSEAKNFFDKYDLIECKMQDNIEG